MVKDNNDAKHPTHNSVRSASKRGKIDPEPEESHDPDIEEQIKSSNNTCVDKEGTVYSCHFHLSSGTNDEVVFNTYNKNEILNPNLKGLNLYSRVNYPRFKLDKKEVQEKGKGISKEAFEAFLEIIKCPVWLEVMQDPVNVKTCLHKFCNKCIERYIRVEKKECPTCRTAIGSRRLLRKDTKLREIIERLIPNLEDYQVYEQEEVQRNIKAIRKSETHMQKMLEMQKRKEQQYRAEIEERKEQKTPKNRTPTASRRAEPRTRPAVRQREAVAADRRYRQSKRPKLEEPKHEINIKFKIKQLSSTSNYPCKPRPGQRIIQSMLLETNDQLCLKHLTKYIKMKATNVNLDNHSISYYVRGKDDRSQFDKIISSDTSLKELAQAYWPDDRVHSVYFMI